MSHRNNTNNIKYNGHIYKYVNAIRIYTAPNFMSAFVKSRQLGWKYKYVCKTCGDIFNKYRVDGKYKEVYKTIYSSESCNDKKMKQLLL